MSESLVLDDAFSEVKTIGVALSEDLVFSNSVGITKSVTQSISETLVLDDDSLSKDNWCFIK